MSGFNRKTAKKVPKKKYGKDTFFRRIARTHI